MAKVEKSEMTKKELKSSSSTEMDDLKRQKAIQELGHKLIKELDEPDLTTKWMAAHLSELMIEAEENPSRKLECQDLILTLWRERRYFPSGDPMERFGRTLETLEAYLNTGKPLFEVWLGGRNTKSEKRDWADLARIIKRQSEFLTGKAVSYASESDNLQEDKLLDIAHLAAPDAESHVLNILRIEILGNDGKVDESETVDQVIEALAELRGVLDEFEAAYRDSLV